MAAHGLFAGVELFAELGFGFLFALLFIAGNGLRRTVFCVVTPPSDESRIIHQFDYIGLAEKPLAVAGRGGGVFSGANKARVTVSVGLIHGGIQQPRHLPRIDPVREILVLRGKVAYLDSFSALQAFPHDVVRIARRQTRRTRRFLLYGAAVAQGFHFGAFKPVGRTSRHFLITEQLPGIDKDADRFRADA